VHDGAIEISSGTTMKWCDYSCEHAAFPQQGLEGACRTVAAVWCKKLGRLIPKNSPCQIPVEGRVTQERPRSKGKKG
jgi:hypothetical protein